MGPFFLHHNNGIECEKTWVSEKKHAYFVDPTRQEILLEIPCWQEIEHASVKGSISLAYVYVINMDIVVIMTMCPSVLLYNLYNASDIFEFTIVFLVKGYTYSILLFLLCPLIGINFGSFYFTDVISF